MFNKNQFIIKIDDEVNETDNHTDTNSNSNSDNNLEKNDLSFKDIKFDDNLNENLNDSKEKKQDIHSLWININTSKDNLTELSIDTSNSDENSITSFDIKSWDDKFNQTKSSSFVWEEEKWISISFSGNNNSNDSKENKEEIENKVSSIEKEEKNIKNETNDILFDDWFSLIDEIDSDELEKKFSSIIKEKKSFRKKILIYLILSLISISFLYWIYIFISSFDLKSNSNEYEEKYYNSLLLLNEKELEIERLTNLLSSWNYDYLWNENSDSNSQALDTSYNYIFNRDLYIWLRWDDVVYLQEFLIENWYWVNWIWATWYFWDITLSKIKAYLLENHSITFSNIVELEYLNRYIIK